MLYKYTMAVSLPSGLTPWVWYDAADSSTVSTSGTSVTGWMNKGSSAGGSGSVSGTVSYGTKTINGLPVVSLDSTGSFTTPSITATAQPFAAFWVSRLNRTNPDWNSQLIFSSSMGGSTPQLVYYSQSGNFIQGNINGATRVNTSNQPDFNSRVLLCGVVNSATVANNILTVNGLSQSLSANTAAGGATLSATTYTIGGWQDIAELVIYMGEITAAQRQQIEGYMAWKWGMQAQLPTTHPYSVEIYSHNLSQRPLPTPWLWYDAADTSTITKTGTALTGWSNKGSAGGGSGSVSGTVTHNVATINGLPTVTIGSSSTFTTPSITPTSQSSSVFIVNRVNVDVPLNTWPAVITYSAQGLPYVFFGNDSTYGYNVGMRASNENKVVASTRNHNGRVGVYSLVNSTANANNTITINGAAQTLAISTAAGGQTLSTGTFSMSLQSDVAEIMIFMGEMDAVQRQIVEGYLAWKWGLQGSLPVSHPFFSVPYINRSLQQYSMPQTVRPWLWYDAADDSTIMKNGTTVTGWANKGNGCKGYGTITGTVNHGTTTINNRTVMSMSGGSSFAIPTVVPTEGGFTNFAVVRINGTMTTEWAVVGLPTVGSTAYGQGFFITYTSATSYFIEAQNRAVSTNTRTTISNPNGNFMLLSSVNSASSTSNNFIGINGTSQTLGVNSVANSTAPASVSDYLICPPSNQTSVSIDVAEVIMFQGQLNAVQRQQVEGYLAWKWGLQAQLPAGHPYKTPFIGSPIMTNPWVWFDAADSSTITLSGSNLSGWTNKGFAGGSASVTAGSATVGTELMNGRNTVTVAGSSYLTTTSIQPTQQAYSVFSVVRPNTVGTNYVVFLQAFASIAAYLNNNTIRGDTSSVENKIAATYTGIDGATRLYSIVNSAFSTASNVIAVDGTTQTLTLNLVSSGMSLTSQAHNLMNVTSAGNPASLGELLVFMGEMTTAQRQQVEGYLAQKWGLQGQLPITHPFYPITRSVWSIADNWNTRNMSVAGCRLWLDAGYSHWNASGNTNPRMLAAPSAIWIDKIYGYTSDAALGIATAAGGPLVQEASLNGLGTIRLRGPTDYFIVPNNFTEPGHTVIGLFRVVSIPASGRVGIFSTDTAFLYGRGLGIYNGNFELLSNDAFVNTNIAVTPQVWYLCSLTYDATSTCKFRIFGTSTNITVANGTPDNNTGFKIGIWNAYNDSTISGNNTNMDVAEIMCFNRALSTSEVSTLESYIAWKWGIVSMTSVASNRYQTLISTPLSAPQTVSATSASSAAIVSWTPPARDGGSPITGYRVIASPGGSFVEVNAEARSARITGLTNGTSYTFTVAAKNTVGYGVASAATAAVIPSANVAPVYNGGSYYFNGANTTGITIPNTADLRFGTGDFTIEWWQYWMPYGTQTDRGAWQYTRVWMFGRTFDASLVFNFNSGWGPLFYIGTSSTLTADNPYDITQFFYKWRHIAITRKDGFVRVFVDGQVISSGTNTASFTDSSRNLVIGSDSDGYPFNGFISQFHYVAGTALYTSEFIPPTSEIQPVANTKILLLAKSSGTMTTDFSPVGRTGITATGVAWSPAGPYAPIVSMPYQREIVSTFAGSGSAALTDATGTAAAFNNTTGISIDASDNVYAADFYNNKIRMITPAGVVSSVAGTVTNPMHVVRDSAGNLFASSWTTHQIWKLSAGGTTFVSFAGSTAGTSGYQDGTGSGALFNNPSRMAIDASDNLYVCDYGNNKIRRITSAGVVTTFAGPLSGTAMGTADGAANSATFTSPISCAFDSQGNLFVCDLGSHKIRRITPAGVVSTFAGAPVGSTASGDVDGRGTTARFNLPDGITIDKYDNIYVFDRGTYKIRKITPDGVVSTVIGNPMGFNTAGFANGIDQGARFAAVEGLCFDTNGNLFISNGGSHRIRRAALGSRWQVQTIAGLAGTAGTAVGDVYGVRFSSPGSVAVGNDGSVYVCEYGNNRVVKITPDGNAVVFAGSGTAGGADGVGAAATFNRPMGCCIDRNENLFVVERDGSRVRKITPAGHVTTIAGTDTNGYADGQGSVAQLSFVQAICIDASDNLYIADSYNHRIRKLTPTVDGYYVTTYAGTGTPASTNASTAIASTFNYPSGVTIDPSGNLYVTEVPNSSIRKIAPNGGAVTTITTAVGNLRGIRYNKYDGFVYYGGSNRVYRMTTAGTGETLIAGSATEGSADGVGSAAGFGTYPHDVEPDAYGNLYIPDWTNQTIRLVKYAIAPAAPTVSASGTTISWTAPADNGLPITGYDVLNSYGARVATLGPSTLSYTATVSGTYRVRAINNAGTSTATAITVSSISVPGAPTGVSATAFVRQALVNWTAPTSNGGAAITVYRLFDQSGNQVGSVEGTSASIMNLTAGQTYIFTVRAVNSAGVGAASAASNAVVPYTTPGVPQNVAATDGSGQVVVSWSAPLLDGSSAIIGYRITSGGVNTDVSANVFSRTFTGLTAGTTYSYTVSALNAAGYGSASAAVSLLVFGKPGVPQNVSATDGSGQVVVSWTAPLLDGSSALIGYRITDQSGNTTDVSANVLTRTFTSLVAGRTYSYTVAAQNAAGYGTASSAASRLVFGKASAPQNVQLTDGSGQLTISWSAPLSDGSSNISWYNIRAVNSDNIQSYSISTSANPGVSSWTFTGLTAGYTYSFYMTATNAAGEGAASATVSRLVFGKPGVPRNVSATDGSGQVVLSWQAPLLDGSSALIGYRITDQSGNITDVSANVVTRTFTSLIAGSTYSYTVAAQNAAGYGTASSAASLLVFGKPGQPTNVVAAGGNRSAVITWTAAAANSSTITNYRITASPGGATVDVSGSLTSGSVSGLTNGTSYTFTVVATNAAGAGTASSASNAVVPNAPPTGPFYVINMATGDFKVGNTATTNLYTSPTDLSDEDGIPVGGYSYVWQVADVSSEASFANISGATASTYVIDGAYSGKFIRAIVSYTDNKGTLESVKATAVGPIQITVPYAPTGVLAVPLNSSASVSWTAPFSDGGSAITMYTITSTPGSFTKDVSGNQTSGIVNGLTNGTSYTFTVVARNAVGSGTASSPSASVIPYTNPGQPAITNVVSGNGYLRVSFDPPTNTGGYPITSYSLFNSNGTSLIKSNISPSATYVDVSEADGLTIGNAYLFRMKAYTAVGQTTTTIAYSGSGTMLGTIPDAPTVSAVAGSSKITLSITPPAYDGFYTITKYSIYTSAGAFVQDVSASVSSVDISATPGSSYSYKVSAWNSIGESVQSGATTSVVAYTTPGAPRSLSATDGSGQVVVSWQAPLLDGSSAIIGYRITDQDGNTTDVSANVVSRTFTSLTAGLTYSYTVAALNAAGYGTASSAASLLVFGKPGTPRNVAATDGSGQIVLSWSAPLLDGSSALISYRITDQSGNITDVSANVVSRTFTGLTAGNTYSYTVAALNAAGYGTASAAASLLVFGLPGSPTNVVAAGGNTTAVITWTAAFANSSAITKYTITASPGGATADVSGSQTSGSVSGLTNGVSYTFTVVATNAAGAGSASTASNAVVPNALPTGSFYVVNLDGGSYKVGNAAATNLYASPSDISDADGIPTAAYTYKWQIADVSADASFTDVSSRPVPSFVSDSSSCAFFMNFTNDTNSSTNLTDASPNGNNFLRRYATFDTIAGRYAMVVPPAGTTRYNFPYLIKSNWINTNTLTWSVWVYMTSSAGTSKAIIYTRYNTSGASGLAINGTQLVYTWNYKYYQTPRNLTVDVNKWTHIAVSTTPTDAKFYKNGILVDTLTAAHDVAAFNVFYIGADPISDASGSNFPGYIDDVAVFTRTLSDSEIKQLAASSYVIPAIYTGKYLRSIVSYTDNAGNAESVTASAVGPIVTTVPYAPTIGTAVAGNGQATVSWTAPNDGGLAISKYTITSSPGSITKDISGNQVSGTITGLTNGVSYTFTVTATNANGTGAASAASNTVMPITTATAPQNFTATAGSLQIALSWSAPASNGGSAIQYYRITDQSGNTTDVSEATSQTFSGLTAGSTYSYTIYAFNAAGVGATASASAIPYTVPGVPRNVSATDGSGQIVLTWQAPLLDGSSALISYRITDQSGNTTDVSANVVTRTFTSLVAGRTYSYTVAALNAAGYGSASSAASLLVFGKPGIPTSVVAAGGNRSAVITWSAASANSSTITKYTITASPGGATVDVSGSQTSGSVSGLTNGVSYTFTVVATNAAGAGSASSASNAVIPNAPPTGPFYVVNLAGGSYKVGNTATTNLYTSPTDLSDEDGIPVGGYSYVWQVADVSSDASFSAISGATASTYVMPAAYIGKYIRAIVSYTDNAGTLETVKSSAVGPLVSTVPYAPTGVSAVAGDMQATVSWTAPNDGGLSISKYTIVADPADVAPVDVSGNLTSAVVSGLEVNTSYTFTVYATNANGAGSSSTASSAITTTDYPAALTFTDVSAGNGFVRLTWSAPSDGGSAILSYTIYNLTDSVQYTGITGTTYDVSGLTNDVEYTFAISATNANGEGSSSGGSVAATPYTVPDAPAGVLAVSLNTGDIRVAWNTPASNGRPILGYRITDGSGNTTLAPSSPWTFTGLELGRTYSYTVAARNLAGYSVESAQVSALARTTPTAPQNVQAVADISSVVLSWSAPASNGGSAITVYRIYNEIGTKIGSDVSGLSTTISGLTNGQEYTFYVRAVNVAGESENSDAATTTPRRAPDAPTIVHVEYGNTYIDLSWNAPAFDGGSAVLDYRVYYNGATKDVNGTSTRLTDLSNGLLYTLRVAARNVVGYGTLSDSFTATPSTVPDAPVMGTPVAASRRITVHWSAPAWNGGAVVSSYELYFDGSSSAIATGITGTSYTVINLTNDVQYQFRVKAVNINGAGALSAASTAIAPFNSPPTGDVDISGLIVEGAAIQMVNTLADVDGLGTLQYKWFRVVSGVSSEIVAQILPTYTVSQADVGTTLYGMIYYTDEAGTNEIAYSETVGPVAAFVVQNVSAIAGNGYVDLSWNVPTTNGKTITGYHIVYHLSSTDASGAPTQDVSGLSARVSGLTNGESYTFLVSAAYDGTYGTAATVQEIPYTVPNAPTIVSTVADVSSIRVAWSAPAFNGGRSVLGYDLSCNGQVVQLGASDLSYNVVGLTNGQSYTIEVRARNIDGLGAAASTSEIPFTTASAPSITSIVAANESVALSWSTPFNGGRSISGYRVRYGFNYVDVSDNSYEVGGLTNDVQYEFRVAALTIAGEGALSAPAYETPYTVPDAPTGLTATAGVEQISLSWTAPAGNGRPVLGYTVRESRGTTYDISDGTTSTTITDLSNGSVYTYTVEAYNIAGSGSASGSATATPRTVPDAPTGLVAYPNNGVIDISWNAPYNGGASITQYRIVYGDLSGSSASTTFRASGLTNGVPYVFYVYAINEAGSSTGASIASTPRTVPDTPQSTSPAFVKADGEITVYWDIPAFDGGSAITGYRVAYGATSVDLSAHVLEYTASQLTNGQSYTFNIYAINVAGESATPLSITATPRRTPDAVENLVAYHKSGAVDISWNAPAFNGGADIQYYRVSYNGTYVDVSSGTTTTISGLTNGTSYTFVVAAYNEAGFGTSASVSATPSTLPGKPTITSAVGSNGSVALSWSVSNGGATITSSRISYVPAAGGSSSTYNVSGSATSATISGLTNGVYYLFTVEASNLNGTGEASAHSSPVAPYTAPAAPVITSVVSHDGFMRIAWSHSGATGGFDLSAFAVYLSDGTLVKGSIDPAARTIDISENLTVGSSYQFKMKAFSAGSYGEAAESDFSGVSSAVILGTRPAAPGLVDVSSGDATIRVSWSAPSDGYYAISKYTVYSAAGAILADNISASASYVDISVANGVPIAVKMTATNQIGESDFSATTAEVIPSRVPDQPTSLTATHGDREIALSWSAPVNDGSANIVKYGVYYADGSAIDENVVGTSFTVGDLSNGETYTFKVAAFNLRGRGAFSATASEVPSRVPNQPTNVNATAGSRSATVYWDAPAANGSAITLYEVYDASETKWADTSNTLVDISGLTNGVYYQFKVRAQNRDGFGAFSTLSNAVRPNADVSGSVDISGIYMEGQTVEAVLNISDEDGLPALFNYQWQVASATVGPYTDISGAIQSTFAITAAYVRKYLRVYVSYTDLAGVPEEIYSGYIGPVNDVPSGLDISGAAVEGQTLSADLTNFVDQDGYDVATFNYQWSDSSDGVVFTNITGATASTLLLTQSQVDKYVRLVVSYTDNTGMPHVISATTGPVANINNAPTGQALISGTVAIGQTVSVDFTQVSDLDGIDMNTLSYQWQIADAADGFFEDICGETQVSIEIDRAKVNQFLRVQVEYTDLYGANEQVISVVSSAVPPTVADAPTSLSAAHGDTYVDLSWNAPAWTGGIDLSGYIVYHVDGATNTEVGRTGAATRNIRVSDLSNGTLYIFKVAAYNAVGTGSLSASASETPSRPASAPTDVSAAHANGYATVSWSTPASDGGATITAYKIFNGSTEVASVGAAIRVADVSGLTNGVSYTFTVRAVNRNGLGDGANVSVVPSRVPDAPTSVSATYGDREITISWVAPAFNGGAAILGYYVYGSGLTTKDVSGLSTTFSGLTNGTSYSFYVRAYNLNGPGASSASVSEYPSTTPSEPLDISGTFGHESAYLSWSAPTSNGGAAIQGYRIYEGTTLRGTAGPSDLSGTATGLTNGSPSILHVVAYNRSGEGTSSATITITPSGFASAPQNLTAVSADSSVSLSWSAPNYDGGADITSYNIKTYNGATLVSSTDVIGLSGVVSGLTNGTTYTFVVAARNLSGLGSTVSTTSKPFTTPGPVRSLAATRGDGQLSLSWLAPVSNGGDAITSYRIIRDGSVVVNTGTTTTSRTITGLNNGQSYSFSVQAENARGVGTAVDVSGTPSRAPDAITDASGSYGDRTATLYWSAPYDGGSAILQYRVYLNGVERAIVSAATRSYTFSLLTNGTTYTMTVRAENHTLAASSNAVLQTPRTRPSAPTLTAVDPSRNLVRVSWSVPYNGGATITRFEVGDVSAGNAVVATVSSATATYVDVSGLTNGQAYRYVVRAVNSEGAGPWSAQSSLVYPGDVPSKPSITGLSYADGSITVSWSAPTDLGGFAVDTYRITYTGGAAPVDVSGNLLTKTINGLTNGTLYQFRVYAINFKGISAPSDISTAIKPSRFPDAPAQPVISGHADGSITIQWTAPYDGGDAIQGYRVYIDGSNVVKANPLVPTTSATITGLTNGTSYQFRVHAYNRDGPSPLSDASNPEYPSRKPDAAVIATPTHGNGQISLSWTKPYDGGSPITNYKVYRQTVGTTAWDIIETISDENTLSTTATGVNNGVAYVFRVDTSNRDGTTMSLPSAEVVPSTIPNAPLTPVAVHGNEFADLSWSPPSWNGGNAVQGYRVFDISADETTATPLADVSGLSARILDLSNGTSYIFKVLAYNINGQGPTASAAAVVPSRIPNAVVIAAAKPGDKSVLLRWTTPYNGGALITSYRIYDAATNNVLRDVSGADTLTTLFTGLTNNQTYSYKVKAYNLNGFSENFSNDISATPFLVDLSENLPPKQQETVLTTTITKVNETTGASTQEVVPLVATTLDNNKDTGVVSVVTSDPKLSNVMVAGLPTAGEKVVDEVVVAVAPKTQDFGIIIAVKAFQTVQSGESTTRTKVSDFTENPLTIVMTLPGETAATVDVYTRPDASQEFRLEGKARLISAAAHTYSITITHLTEFAFKVLNIVPCFPMGTRVLTAAGYKAVEKLTAADRLITSDGRTVPFARAMELVEKTTTENAPYYIPAHTFGRNQPAAPITLSPHHAFQSRKGVWQIPQHAAASHSQIKQVDVGRAVLYFHLKLPNYLRDNVVVEGGVVAESYGGPEYGSVDTIYKYSARLGGYTRRSDSAVLRR